MPLEAVSLCIPRSAVRLRVVSHEVAEHAVRASRFTVVAVAA